MDRAADVGNDRSLHRHQGVRAGILAAAGMAVFYAVVVGGLSGSTAHLVDQIAADRYLPVPIVAAFGVQVGLMSELKRRHQLRRGAAAAGVAGAGASTVGMVACCAHHLADLAPFLGATAAATFLADYRLPFMVGGLLVNGLGIAVVARRLRRVGVGVRDGSEETCAIEGSS